jgi:putative addiction module CopG family antidote
MKIDLTPRHRQFVDEKVKIGACASADEVVWEGVRLLEAEEERNRRIKWLQAEVEKGFAGPFTPWTPKDSDHVRKLITREARRKR